MFVAVPNASIQEEKERLEKERLARLARAAAKEREADLLLAARRKGTRCHGWFALAPRVGKLAANCCVSLLG